MGNKSIKFAIFNNNQNKLCHKSAVPKPKYYSQSKNRSLCRRSTTNNEILSSEIQEGAVNDELNSRESETAVSNHQNDFQNKNEAKQNVISESTISQNKNSHDIKKKLRFQEDVKDNQVDEMETERFHVSDHQMIENFTEDLDKDEQQSVKSANDRTKEKPVDKLSSKQKEQNLPTRKNKKMSKKDKKLNRINKTISNDQSEQSYLNNCSDSDSKELSILEFKRMIYRDLTYLQKPIRHVKCNYCADKFYDIDNMKRILKKIYLYSPDRGYLVTRREEMTF